MTFPITVITCTHNPRLHYLRATLDGLASQTLPPDQWEFLLVDNDSEPGRFEQVDLSWHPGGRLIQEEKLGLTPARLRGIREAKGELLVFVDDDNVLASDFLVQAWEVFRHRPYLGAWSGQCHPRFDEAPPEWTRRYWENLVIREFVSDRWSNLPRLPETMPCGAGLCVRRAVAERYVQLHEQGLRGFQFDRSGSSLISGGDNDLAACGCDLGLGVGLVAALHLTHLIPPERLTVTYLSRLAEGISFSSVMLDQLWGLDPQPRSMARKALDFVRFLRLAPRDRAIQRSAVFGAEKALKAIHVGKDPRG